MTIKTFYDNHRNFYARTLSEYYISPGIKCKFDILLENIGKNKKFINGIDLGCSGNSILNFIENVKNKSFYDIASIPLNQYVSKKITKSPPHLKRDYLHPLCGDLTNLPYRDNSFDILFTLDTLEHIKDDKSAISEISRILKKDGIAVITVPHREDYYKAQNKLIGHFRRYEIDKLIKLFKKYKLKILRTYGVYGQFMTFSRLQTINPIKTEKSILKLRSHYISNRIFRRFWDIVNKIVSKLMKIDAKYQSVKKIMNMGLIFQKS